MDKKLVTVIVPRLPPFVDGLGDYGLSLAKEMRKNFQVETRFIVCDLNWNGESVLDGFKVLKLTSRSKKGLLDLLRTQDTIILHYVGYGYAKRGCPLWLVDALEEWKNQISHRKLITMFHELYAYGPIWTSQFWTSPVQQLLAKRIGELSDHCITSKGDYASTLSQMVSLEIDKIPVLPVFSNVGEPTNNLPLQMREKRIVIFGNKESRRRIYQKSIQDLEVIISKFKIQEIVDIGPELEFEIPIIADLKVKILGIKSSSEISDILKTALVGYLNYPTAYLAKSGVFAAYTAHQLLIVVSNSKGQIVDGVIQNEHYIVVNGESTFPTDLTSLQVIAEKGHCWYLGHALCIHAQTFFQFF